MQWRHLLVRFTRRLLCERVGAGGAAYCRLSEPGHAGDGVVYADYFFSISGGLLLLFGVCVGAAPVLVPVRGPVVLSRGWAGVISAGGIPPGVVGTVCGWRLPPACCARLAVPANAISEAANIASAKVFLCIGRLHRCWRQHLLIIGVPMDSDLDAFGGVSADWVHTGVIA
jgi:hypothetical protein